MYYANREKLKKLFMLNDNGLKELIQLSKEGRAKCSIKEKYIEFLYGEISSTVYCSDDYDEDYDDDPDYYEEYNYTLISPKLRIYIDNREDTHLYDKHIFNMPDIVWPHVDCGGNICFGDGDVDSTMRRFMINNMLINTYYLFADFMSITINEQGFFNIPEGMTSSEATRCCSCNATIFDREPQNQFKDKKELCYACIKRITFSETTMKKIYGSSTCRCLYCGKIKMKITKKCPYCKKTID